MFTEKEDPSLSMDGASGGSSGSKMNFVATSKTDQREKNLKLIDEKLKQLQTTRRWDRIQKFVTTFPSKIDADKPDFDIKADVGFSIVGGLETYLRPRVPLYDDMSVLQEKLFKALKPFMLVTCKIIRSESSGMRLQLKHVHVEDVLLDCLEEVNVVGHLPTSNMGDSKLQDFKAGDYVCTFIKEIDYGAHFIELSLKKDDLCWRRNLLGKRSDDLEQFQLSGNQFKDYALNLYKDLAFQNPNSIEFMIDYYELDDISTFCDRRAYNSADTYEKMRTYIFDDQAHYVLNTAIKATREQKHKKAIELYDKVLEISEKNTDALVGKGVVYANMGAYVDAIQFFEKALEINPTHPNAAKYLERVQAKLDGKDLPSDKPEGEKKSGEQPKDAKANIGQLKALLQKAIETPDKKKKKKRNKKKKRVDDSDNNNNGNEKKDEKKDKKERRHGRSLSRSPSASPAHSLDSDEKIKNTNGTKHEGSKSPEFKYSISPTEKKPLAGSADEVKKSSSENDKRVNNNDKNTKDKEKERDSYRRRSRSRSRSRARRRSRSRSRSRSRERRRERERERERNRDKDRESRDKDRDRGDLLKDRNFRDEKDKEKDRNNKDKEKDRDAKDKERDRNRDRDSKTESKDKEKRDAAKDKEKDTKERENREKKEKDAKERDSKDATNNDREKDLRESNKEKEKEREKDKKDDKNKEKEKSRDKQEKDREKKDEKDLLATKDKEKDKDKKQDRSRDRRRSKSRSRDRRRSRSRSKSRDRRRKRSRSRSKSRSRDRKRSKRSKSKSRSRSRSRDRDRKRRRSRSRSRSGSRDRKRRKL